MKLFTIMYIDRIQKIYISGITSASLPTSRVYIPYGSSKDFRDFLQVNELHLFALRLFRRRNSDAINV